MRTAHQDTRNNTETWEPNVYMYVFLYVIQARRCEMIAFLGISLRMDLFRLRKIASLPDTTSSTLANRT